MVTEKEFEIFVAESSSSAILDCGASATVSGINWFNSYFQGLSEEKQMEVQYCESNSYFKFGTGEKFKSKFKVIFPATIGSNDVMIQSDVVETNVPLLLSLKSMKNAQTEINYVTDTVKMFGQEQKIHFTQCGHYAIPLNNSKSIIEDLDKFKNTKITLFTADDTNKKKIALKLHAQFGHPPKSKLVKLLERAGCGSDKELLRELDHVYDKCQVCMEYQKPSPRPCVGLPHADTFNETVAMDLKFFNGHIILHLIDHLTRFSAGYICKSKEPKEIVSGIIQCWISIFGPPQKFLTDNGGEFSNKLFLDLAEQMNIRVMTTAAESPWSNGLVERHNATLAETLYKVTADNQKIDIRTALAWSINAKNSLTNVNGFSPSQLALGYNPQVPNVLVNKPPGLENASEDVIITHLNTIRTARKAFIEAESSERIKRALKRNLRPSSHNKFCTGDLVYYKRKDCRKWRGPGRVIGSESSNLLIKHGSNYVRVHACRVMFDRNENCIGDVKVGDDKSGEKVEENMEENKDKDCECIESDEYSETEGEDRDDANNERKGGSSERLSSTEEQIPEINDSNQEAQTENEVKKIKKGMLIEFEKNNGEVVCGQIFKRSGKATGKYGHFWYVKDDVTGELEEYDTKNDWKNWQERNQEEEDSRDDEVHEVHITNEELKLERDGKIMQAKEEEINKWREEEVIEEVEDHGQRRISTTWVITDKKENTGTIVKARLVARGYEDESDVRSDSPTCMKDSIRLMLSVAVSRGWKIHSLDVKAAFLQGQQIARDLYIFPPKEFRKKGYLWKLRKVVYGLNDASRSWYLKVSQVLKELKMKSTKFDKAVFVPSGGNLEGIIVIHVDDLMFFGSDSFLLNVMKPFKAKFKISKEESEIFKYLGIKISQSNGCISLDQNEYLASVKADLLPSEAMRAKERNVSEEEVRRFKQGVGQLGWLTTISKPEAAFMYCLLSTVQAHPSVKDFLKYKKIINELKNVNSSIKLKPLDLDGLTISAYSDASFGSLEGGASQLGYVIFLQDSSFNASPVSWASKKAKRVCRSSLTAETLAAVEAIDGAFVVKEMMEDILHKKLPPIMLYVDSKSLYDTVKTSNVIADKRLLIDMAAIREMSDNKEIIVNWVRTEDQLADVLTKAGANKAKLIDVLSNGRLLV